MSFEKNSKPSPAYYKLEEPDVQSTSTYGNQYNLYSGVYQYPSPGGAQHPGSQYESQYNVPGQVPTSVRTQPGAMVLNQAPVTEDWMVPAVLSCLLCCWPIGICAIRAACKANRAAAAGDVMEAERQSRCARTWVIISVIVGSIMFILFMISRVFAHSSQE